MTNKICKQQLFIQLANKLSSDKLCFGHGVIDGEDEAMMIMMHVFSQSVDEILTSGNDIVDKKSIEKALKFANQRLSNLKPMAYILGKVHFADLEFYSDDRALVPRSPIAELILNGFTQWLDISKIKTALDLCTGSGCIGIALAKHHPHIKVDISDISQKALELAEKNIKLNQIKHSVTSHASDLFSCLNKKYDLILTNPPYVSDDEYQQLPNEYKAEPKLGLVTSHSGLKIPVEILFHAPDFMTDEACLFLEVGYSDELLEDAFSEIKFNWVDFSNGGEGVCVFTRKSLLEYHHYFKSFLENQHGV